MFGGEAPLIYPRSKMLKVLFIEQMLRKSKGGTGTDKYD